MENVMAIIEWCNWSEMAPGELMKRSFTIFYDKSYAKKCIYNREVHNNDLSKDKVVTSNGILTDKDFNQILKCLENDDWGKKKLSSDICDGSVWKIEYYKDGKLLKSTRNYGLIHGIKSLEKIVKLLPESD